jgi:hypothetical protein
MYQGHTCLIKEFSLDKLGIFSKCNVNIRIQRLLIEVLLGVIFRHNEYYIRFDLLGGVLVRNIVVALTEEKVSA